MEAVLKAAPPVPFPGDTRWKEVAYWDAERARWQLPYREPDEKCNYRCFQKRTYHHLRYCQNDAGRWTDREEREVARRWRELRGQ